MSNDKVWEGKQFKVEALGTYLNRSDMEGVTILLTTGGAVVSGVLYYWNKDGMAMYLSFKKNGRTVVTAVLSDTFTVVEVPEVEVVIPDEPHNLGQIVAIDGVTSKFLLSFPWRIRGFKGPLVDGYDNSHWSWGDIVTFADGRQIRVSSAPSFDEVAEG